MFFDTGYGENIIFAVMMGMITGMGGGVFRDVLVSLPPYALKKHVYALASIVGGVAYYILRIDEGRKIIGTIVSMLNVFVIRMIATKKNWELPKINF